MRSQKLSFQVESAYAIYSFLTLLSPSKWAKLIGKWRKNCLPVPLNRPLNRQNEKIHPSRRSALFPGPKRDEKGRGGDKRTMTASLFVVCKPPCGAHLFNLSDFYLSVFLRVPITMPDAALPVSRTASHSSGALSSPVFGELGLGAAVGAGLFSVYVFSKVIFSATLAS